MWCSLKFDSRNRRKLHVAYKPVLEDHATHRTTPAAGPHKSTLCRMYHLYSAGLPPQCLVYLLVRGRLCIDTRIVPQPIMPGTILRCDPHARMHRKPPLWPRPCITAAISLLSSPRHSNSPSTRYSTSACTRSTQASFTCAPRKTSACRPGATTPSSMYKCKCTCAFSVAPKRCTHSTPPLRAAFAVLVLARAVAPCTALIAIAATRYRQHASTAAVHSGRRTLG